ncbi:hypothetical protein BGX23_000394 [Mortierella sp. AD031]|nr:hypothetical protein BGX23_000394 [Mortierella sp. AD031]KAG0213110.1 hypothetical protein BGX33_003158 [Mortierella sp. NVP41]
MSLSSLHTPPRIRPQRFQRGETTVSIEVQCDAVSGFYYSSITQVRASFQGAIRFKVGEAFAEFLDNSFDRIRYYPDEVVSVFTEDDFVIKHGPGYTPPSPPDNSDGLNSSNSFNVTITDADYCIPNNYNNNTSLPTPCSPPHSHSRSHSANNTYFAMPHSRSASTSGAYPPRSPSPTPRAPQYRVPSTMPFEDSYHTLHDPTMLKYGHTRSKSGGHSPSQAFPPFAFPHGHTMTRIPSPDPGLSSAAYFPPDFALWVMEMLTRIYGQGETTIGLQTETIGNQVQQDVKLDMLQKSIDTVLIQNYELHEYPIPRYFVILPEKEGATNGQSLFKSFKGNLKDRFVERYRLYFLCECGEHAEEGAKLNLDPSAPRTWDLKNLRRMHLADHDGYEITRPKKFFAQYGPYVLGVLKALQVVLLAASAVAPVTVHLSTGADSMARLTETLTKNTLDAITGSIDYVNTNLDPGAVMELHDQSSTYGQNADDLTNSLKALAGADLRQLDTFLEKKDQNNTLGNLSRITTSEGHVKWVCQDHYPIALKNMQLRSLIKEVRGYKGLYDEILGKITLTLPSSARTRSFSERLLEQTTTIDELDLTITWNFATLDLQELKDLVAAIRSTNIRILRLDLTDRDRPSGPKDRYHPLLRLYSSPNLQSLSLQGLRSFGTRTIDLPDDTKPSPLRSYHHRNGIGSKDIPRIINILSYCPNLVDLRLGSDVYSLVDGRLCEAIGKLKKLEVFYLWNFKHPTEPTVKGLLSKVLTSINHLRELVIINTVIDPDELHAVVRKFSRDLEVLILDPMHSDFDLVSILGTESSHGAPTTTLAPQSEPSPTSKRMRKPQPPAASMAVAPKVLPFSKLRKLHLNTYMSEDSTKRLARLLPKLSLTHLGLFWNETTVDALQVTDFSPLRSIYFSSFKGDDLKPLWGFIQKKGLSQIESISLEHLRSPGHNLTIKQLKKYALRRLWIGGMKAEFLQVLFRYLNLTKLEVLAIVNCEYTWAVEAVLARRHIEFSRKGLKVYLAHAEQRENVGDADAYKPKEREEKNTYESTRLLRQHVEIDTAVNDMNLRHKLMVLMD